MRIIILCYLVGAAWCSEQDWLPIVHKTAAYPSYSPQSDPSIDSSSQLRILNRPSYQSSPYDSSKYSGLFKPVPVTETDSCSVYKVSMNQELFYQYLEYDTKLPDLKEFTLCMWSKYHNHSADHPLFSYAGKICNFSKQDYT